MQCLIAAGWFFLMIILKTVSLNRYLYIDLGTNDGSSIDAFLPATSNNKTKNIASDGSLARNKNILFFSPPGIQNKSDPKYNKSNYEIYAVEANPIFTAKLLLQKQRYEDSRISKSYTLYNGTGISTVNGFGHLILDCAG